MNQLSIRYLNVYLVQLHLHQYKRVFSHSKLVTHANSGLNSHLKFFSVRAIILLNVSWLIVYLYANNKYDFSQRLDWDYNWDIMIGIMMVYKRIVKRKEK